MDRKQSTTVDRAPNGARYRARAARGALGSGTFVTCSEQVNDPDDDEVDAKRGEDRNPNELVCDPPAMLLAPEATAKADCVHREDERQHTEQKESTPYLAPTGGRRVRRAEDHSTLCRRPDLTRTDRISWRALSASGHPLDIARHFRRLVAPVPDHARARSGSPFCAGHCRPDRRPWRGRLRSRGPSHS